MRNRLYMLFFLACLVGCLCACGGGDSAASTESDVTPGVGTDAAPNTQTPSKELPIPFSPKEIDSGEIPFGDRLSWKLYEDGTLVISGQGIMWAFMQPLNARLEQSFSAMLRCSRLQLCKSSIQ